ncbi:MAG TPA: hypothetical protein VN549_00660 [Negativicutes bacterium]|nr:hypothetical protein [Negativicutes bacterium]
METSDDVQVAQKLINDGITLETAKMGIDKSFDKYKPKYPGDKINSLSFCDKVIRQLNEVQRAKEDKEHGADSNDPPREDKKTPKFDKARFYAKG